MQRLLLRQKLLRCQEMPKQRQPQQLMLILPFLLQQQQPRQQRRHCLRGAKSIRHGVLSWCNHMGRRQPST